MYETLGMCCTVARFALSTVYEPELSLQTSTHTHVHTHALYDMQEHAHIGCTNIQKQIRPN